eukprot:TRINITY_DN9191_c0_g1_i1.p1 TRINITY_DN9191_c0_g1~~TRINITY_DN9191_c0_g1_i1.p1  ORF type:complete len:431 (+),score=82.09 TRINITY_DN9191_c0_g1_i1:85-1293(+)
MADLGRLASHLAQPPEADDSMAGPTATSNWVLKGSLLIGGPPASGGMTGLLGAGVTVIVDIRDGQVGTSCDSEGSINRVRYILDDKSYQDRRKQRCFLYHLVDLMAAGECLYVHDDDGHLKCGLVAACLLAGIFQWQPAKSLNRVNQLHGVREKPEGFDCPRTTGPHAARTADLRAYVKDMQESWAWTRGAGDAFMNPGSSPQSSRRGDSSGGRPPSRVQENRCKNSGGGETSFDFRGGGPGSSQINAAREYQAQQPAPRPGSQPGMYHQQGPPSPSPYSPVPQLGPAGGGAAAARGLRTSPSPSPQVSPRPPSQQQSVSTHLMQRQGGAWGFSLAPAVIVTRVDPESPAAFAGVRAGSVLLAIDGTPVDSVDACAQLLSGVHEAELALTGGGGRPPTSATL